MIYLFDKTQTLTGVIETSETIEAKLTLEINKAGILDLTLPASNDINEKMNDVSFIAVPYPNDEEKLFFARLLTRKDEDDRVTYEASELAYHELGSYGVIEDKRPSNQGATSLLNTALEGTPWQVGNVNVAGTTSTNFYKITPLEALNKIVEALGGELIFYVTIQGNKINGAFVDWLAQQGTNTSKTFVHGSNLLTVERQSDRTSIYTAIMPRGKGEETSGEGDEPTGYGRRIEIDGIEWKKSGGKPLDKPSSSKVLVDPEATALWGQRDGRPRLLIQVYEEIEDKNDLINAAYDTLKSINHPQVQYSATVANVGDMKLGDTVVIMHSERSMSYKTRVFKIIYDLQNNVNTEVSFGDNLSANDIASQVQNISTSVSRNSEQITWTMNNGGRNSTSYGPTEPKSPQKGDAWFKSLPNGETEIYVYNGTIWELVMSSEFVDNIDKQITDALDAAKAYADKLNEKQVELTGSLAADVQSKADSLYASQQNIASLANSYTDSAFSEVNEKAVVAKTTADGVYQAVNDPETGLNVRLSTAEGNFEQIKGNVDGMSNTVTKTADGLTQEIKDRETGDSNTLQAGKDFTTSKIQDYDTGMQTQLSQTADGIMASVSLNNMAVDSSLVNGFANWKKFGTDDWEVDENNTYYGIKFAKFNNFSHSNEYSYLTTQTIYRNTFPGNTVYVSVDVNTPRVGESDTDYAEVYLIQQNSSGQQVKFNSITQKMQQPTNGWTNFRQKIDLDTSTSAIYLGYQAVGNVETYIARPYVGVSEPPKNGYIAGPNNNNSTNLSLFYNSFSLGIMANTGALISGINGDSSGLNIVGKKITVTGDTTFIGKNFMDGALIKNATIGNAQIADASINDAKISNLSVDKLTGNISSFIQSNWNGRYGATTIDANGMTVDTSGITTKFGSYGMTLNMTGESVGGIGVQGLTGQPSTYQGLAFWLDGNAEYMAWGARNNGATSGNPVLKLSWFRNTSAPSGAYAGFNFDDDVYFGQGINVQGASTQKLKFGTQNFNNYNYPYFGNPNNQAGFAFGGVATYLIAGTTYYNMSKVIEGLAGLGAVKIPTAINSDGTVKTWANVTL